MVRAAIYARISSDRDGDQLGVRRQIDDCEDRARRKGWDVVARDVDDDVSAYSGRIRPEYVRMLVDLRAGFLDAVVVWHLDRLHRRPKEFDYPLRRQAAQTRCRVLAMAPLMALRG